MPSIPSSIGEVAKAIMINIQEITVTNFEATPLIALIVAIIAQINASGTNKIPKKKIPKIAKTIAKIPAVLPLP